MPSSRRTRTVCSITPSAPVCRRTLAPGAQSRLGLLAGPEGDGDLDLLRLLPHPHHAHGAVRRDRAPPGPALPDQARPRAPPARPARPPRLQPGCGSRRAGPARRWSPAGRAGWPPADQGPGPSPAGAARRPRGRRPRQRWRGPRPRWARRLLRVVGAPPSTSEKGTARRTTALPGRPACRRQDLHPIFVRQAEPGRGERLLDPLAPGPGGGAEGLAVHLHQHPVRSRAPGGTEAGQRHLQRWQRRQRGGRHRPPAHGGAPHGEQQRAPGGEGQQGHIPQGGVPQEGRCQQPRGKRPGPRARLEGQQPPSGAPIESAGGVRGSVDSGCRRPGTGSDGGTRPRPAPEGRGGRGAPGVRGAMRLRRRRSASHRCGAPQLLGIAPPASSRVRLLLPAPPPGAPGRRYSLGRRGLSLPRAGRSSSARPLLTSGRGRSGGTVADTTSGVQRKWGEWGA